MINIGAGTLARPIENIVVTMLHEMCHYYNYTKGIQDCSRGNTYHNKAFKECAEQRDLEVSHTKLSMTWRYAHNTEVIRQQTRDIITEMFKSVDRICW